MRPLPVLSVGSLRWRLPMADSTAAGLLDLLLGGAAKDRAVAAEGLLRDDPPFALWTALCVVGEGDDSESPLVASPADLSPWLSEQALRLLRWDKSDTFSFETPLPEFAASLAHDHEEQDTVAEVAGNLVASAAQKARLATWLATTAADRAGVAPDPSAGFELAIALAAVLEDAEAWCSVAVDRGLPPSAASAEDSIRPVVQSLRRSPSLRQASEFVEQAKAVLRDGGRGLPDVVAAEDALEQAAGQATQAAQDCRQRWLRPLPGPWRWLPQVRAKLARLETLQGRFSEQLEREKLDALAELAAGAGHEINNPLAVIAGRAQLFLRDETDPERRRELALMNAQAKRVYEMIADMRLFARPPQPEHERFDLVALVDRVIDSLEPELARRAIELARGGDSAPLEIDADPTQLTVALEAMCKNAQEAIGHEGQIVITLRDGPTDVAIEVRDTGPGIPPAVRKHLFDPFYSAREAGRGLGFGLSKCWRIVVTNHGGRIEVDDPPGGGARLRMVLPKGRHNTGAAVEKG
jgi:hypothetical protein